MKSPILGSSYVASSVNAACSRMVNLYPEILGPEGKEAAFLSRCPGLTLLKEIGTGPIRGLHQFGNYSYVVSGNKVFRVAADWSYVELGGIAGTSRVSMADNGSQLMIAAGNNGYIYDMNGGWFSPISDPDFPGARTVGYIDGYFVFTEPNSAKVWVTQLFDGMDINALDFASAEGSPDKLISMIVDHREVWLFGEKSVEVWYNSGNADFPLERIQGAFIEIGCAAVNSVAKMDNSVFWLGSDDRGFGVVYRADGYAGKRVSTHAIESQIQKYGPLNDATAYTYQQNGHSFYVLNFPSAKTTWVYDASTQSWHERASWNNGSFDRHRGDCQMVFGGQQIVGDYQSNKIYAMDLDIYDDAGVPQKWLRSWRALPQGANTLRRTVQHELQIDCESGVGTVQGQGSDPQMMLRWSDDGGHTWSNEHHRAMGKIGDTFARIIWRRLGMSLKLRDRVYEVSGTDPVKIAITGAELRLFGTTA